MRPGCAGSGHLSTDDVWNTVVDEGGIVWAATLWGGLNRIDPGTGTLWFGTGRGLARVVPSPDGATASFRAFDALDGLQSDEFNGGAFHRGPSGTLWFGGILGVTGVRPIELKNDPFAALAFWSASKNRCSWKREGLSTRTG